MKKLSIIIPVYNTESYLDKCINSCIRQDLQFLDYEIILIDDGSTDSSKKIALDYSKKYEHILFYEQNNQGQGAVRNRGITLAQGKYVFFVDSDDYLEENVLSYLVNEAEKEDLDVLCFDLNIVDNISKKPYKKIIDKTNGLVVDGTNFTQKVQMQKSPWCAIFKTQYLMKNDLFFLTNVYYEDYEFVARAYYLAKRIKRVPNRIYNYYQRPGSTMKKDGVSQKRCCDWLYVAERLSDFIMENFHKKNHCYYIMINKVSFALAQSLKYYSFSFFSLKEYKRSHFYPISINRFLSFRLKIKYLIINISLYIYVFLLKILKLSNIKFL